MKEEKRNRQIDAVFFSVLLFAVSAVTFFLFNRQTHGRPGYYHSDMKAYILNMQGLDSGYSFPYPVFFKLGAFINLFMEPEVAVAVATMLLNSLAIVILKACFNKMLLHDMENLFPGSRKWVAGVAISLMTTSLFFVSMLFTPPGIYLPGIWDRYRGVFTPNPFHNATYLAARPFAILSFFWFASLLERYENGCSCRMGKVSGAFFGKRKEDKVDVVEYLLYAAALLVTTMTKPSYTLIHVACAGLIMACRFVRSLFLKNNSAGRKASFRENLVSTVFLGLCFIPTFADLLYQFKGVFVPDEGEVGGIGFEAGRVWNLYCGNIPLAVCLACGFPILALVLNYRKLFQNSLYRFSWQLFGMGFLTTYFLYEKGFREGDFNFSWGYAYGLFFCFVGAALVLLERTAGLGKNREKQKREIILVGVQWICFLAHLVCGLWYFGIFLRGGMYY